MKVFVLGGSGKTGFAAIELIAQSDMITEITIAGRDLQRAEEAAAKIGLKAIAVQVDGTDEQKLISLISDCDVVMNAAYNPTVQPAIRAAIRARVNYCDVSWGDVLEPALKLSPEAEAAGITSIVATGISPCISNLMAVYVARQLEEVEQLQIGRADIFDFDTGRELTPQDWLTDSQQSLTSLHEFRSFYSWILQEQQRSGLRNVLYFQDGGWVELNPIINGLDVPRLDSGNLKLFPFLSTDDYIGTLPNDLARMPPVWITFNPFPPQHHNVLGEQTLRMLDGDIDPETVVSNFFNILESDPHRWLSVPDDFVLIPKIWVRAVGRKKGRAASCTCWFTKHMWTVGGFFLTSVALAAAVRMVLRGEIQERGVLSAEKAFDPQSFFNEVVALLPDPPLDGKLIDEFFEWLE